MSSSTSNFRNERKVIGMVLLALFGSELLIRSLETFLSNDLRNIRQIPTVAKNLSDRRKLRILFVGNSLTRHGVNAAVVEKELDAQAENALHVERVYPDDTNIAEWYYLFKHYFVDAGSLPDVLIVGFANSQLHDDQPIHRTRLAHYFTGLRDVPEVFAEDVPDVDGRVEFLLSGLLSSYANRDRVGLRLLAGVIPYYRDSTRTINQTLEIGKGQKDEAADPTFHRLERLLRLAEGRGVKVVLVAMPQPNVYSLSPQIERAVNAANSIFIDARVIEGLGREHYLDEMHLNRGGSTLFSRFLAQHLAASAREGRIKLDGQTMRLINDGKIFRAGEQQP